VHSRCVPILGVLRRLTLGHIEYGVLFIASARRIKQEYAKRTTRTVEFFGSNKANFFRFVIFNSPEVAKNQTLGVKQLTRECTHEV
jgi:hypothetical protein